MHGFIAMAPTRQFLRLADGDDPAVNKQPVAFRPPRQPAWQSPPVQAPPGIG
jgi:hypothetical protein